MPLSVSVNATRHSPPTINGSCNVHDGVATRENGRSVGAVSQTALMCKVQFTANTTETDDRVDPVLMCCFLLTFAAVLDVVETLETTNLNQGYGWDITLAFGGRVPDTIGDSVAPPDTTIGSC